jgi:hypothetical protein
MGWLGLKKRPDRDKDDEDQLQKEPQGPIEPLTPVLNLLVPDIAGVTSFHLRQFFDVEEAQTFVQSLPSTSGIHAFWGLHEPPPDHADGEGTGEAMVLIRSAEASDTVYVVSFVDLDSALSFAKFEVKRGMNLGLLLLYWAELVEVESDEYGIRFVPDVPPLPGYEVRRFTTPAWTDEAEAEAVPASDPTLIVQEAPAPEPVSETAVEAQAPDVSAVDAPAPEIAEIPEEEVATAAQPAWDQTSETFEKQTEDEFEQFVAEQQASRAPAGDADVHEPLEEVPEHRTREPELTPEEEMDIEREAIAFLKAAANGKKPPPETEAGPPADAPEVESKPEAPAEEPAPALAEAEPEPPAAAPVTEPPLKITVAAQAPLSLHDEPDAEEEDSENLVEEVEKILKVKRWDKRESPFRGFDSPPGRF